MKRHQLCTRVPMFFSLSQIHNKFRIKWGLKVIEFVRNFSLFHILHLATLVTHLISTWPDEALCIPPLSLKDI